jgi:tetratricopeptide (TPR) repeat protein
VRLDEADRDLQTAGRLGPKGWASPIVGLGSAAAIKNDMDTAIAYYNKAVELRPNDWFILNTRGIYSYLNGDLRHAKADLERAIALGPDTNFPYAFSAMIMLHEGQLDTAKKLLETMLTKFPDPTFGNRILEAFFGDKIPDAIGPTISGTGNLILGQYDNVVQNTKAALAVNDKLADVYFLQGFAQCNLKQYAEAQESYTRGIEIDPSFVALYFLRSETRLRQGNTSGALEDISVVQKSPQAPAFASFVTAATAGKLGCENFFTFTP